jgi:hypothetical protein
VERINLCRTDDAESMTRGLRITIRMRVRPLRTAGQAAGILLSGGLAWGLLEGSLGEDGSTGSLLGAVSAFSVAALPLLVVAFLGWRLLWGTAGRETILLRRHGVFVRQAIGPFAFARSYSARSGRGCGASRRSGRTPFWELLCIESGRGSVVFCHEDRMVRIARDLDKAEGVYLVTAIRVLMQAR